MFDYVTDQEFMIHTVILVLRTLDVTNWSNSILNPANSGHNWLCKSQEERVKVDIEEAKFQAAKRKEAIERAKTLLYYQTDRVKKFHVSHYLRYHCLD